MRKTITLTKAILKSFIRNWTSIVMLIIFPLILIIILFFSFNPEGLQKVPIGVIGEYADFDMQEYSEYFTYLDIQKYYSLDACTNDLKLHRQYLCMEIQPQTPIIVNIYYDNLQNVVIWEILDRIGSSIEYLQKEKSEEGVSDFLTEFRAALSQLEVFKQQIYSTNSQMDSYISGVDSTIIKLTNARSELSNAVAGMDRDIADAKSARNDVKNNKDAMYNNVMSYFSNYNYLFGINNISDPYTSGARDSINQYNRRIDSDISDIDARIYSYEQTSAMSKGYINDMYNGIIVLGGVKNQLYNHKDSLTKSYQDLGNIQTKFQGISNLDSKNLVSPVVVYNYPVYTGSFNSDVQAETADDVIKGINLLSLQTLFPTMLFLITMFLALLVSGFIALEDINSPAAKRTRLIRGTSFHSMFAVYISSLIITAVPVLCVLIMGSSIFMLPILSKGWGVFLILFLVTSIFINLGALLAQIIKKESITLLTSTFLLILFIFLSGFILPTEKMSDAISFMSNHFPGKIGSNAFAKVVFYEQGVYSMGGELTMLAAWVAVLTITVVAVRRFKR